MVIAVDDMMRLGCVAKAACCCNRGRGTRSSYGDLESRVRQVQIIIWGPFNRGPRHVSSNRQPWRIIFYQWIREYQLIHIEVINANYWE